MEVRTPAGKVLRIRPRKDGWVGSVEERRRGRRTEMLVYEARLPELIAKLALARPDDPWVVETAARIERRGA